MKKLLFILLLIPFLGFTQNSWINIQLLTDNYPSETSWNITPPNGSPIIIQNNSGMLPNTLYDTTIAIQGTIIASIFDQYGDGIITSDNPIDETLFNLVFDVDDVEELLDTTTNYNIEYRVDGILDLDENNRVDILTNDISDTLENDINKQAF